MPPAANCIWAPVLLVLGIGVHLALAARAASKHRPEDGYRPRWSFCDPYEGRGLGPIWGLVAWCALVLRARHRGHARPPECERVALVARVAAFCGVAPSYAERVLRAWDWDAETATFMATYDPRPDYDAPVPAGSAKGDLCAAGVLRWACRADACGLLLLLAPPFAAAVGLLLMGGTRRASAYWAPRYALLGLLMSCLWVGGYVLVSALVEFWGYL